MKQKIKSLDINDWELGLMQSLENVVENVATLHIQLI